MKRKEKRNVNEKMHQQINLKYNFWCKYFWWITFSVATQTLLPSLKAINKHAIVKMFDDSINHFEWIQNGYKMFLDQNQWCENKRKCKLAKIDVLRTWFSIIRLNNCFKKYCRSSNNNECKMIVIFWIIENYLTKIISTP